MASATSAIPSYIPTTTAPVTRSADAATITDLSWLDAAATAVGTFVVAASNETAQASTRLIMALNAFPSSPNFQIYIDGSENIQYSITPDTGNSGIIAGGAVSAGIGFTAAFSYANNDMGAATDGTLGAPDDIVTIPLDINPTTLFIGAQTAGNLMWNGHIKSIRYWPSQLTDEELIELTTSQ